MSAGHRRHRGKPTPPPTPRCPDAAPGDIRCTRPDCADCERVRATVERLSAMTLDGIADYCTTILDAIDSCDFTYGNHPCTMPKGHKGAHRCLASR